MPIHFEDRDVISEVEGLRSVLIVPCNMCPAVTIAVRQNRPFIRLLGNFLRSAPFEQYLKELQSRLRDSGMKADIFRSVPYHQWFMCMWTSGKRRKLQRCVGRYDAVIVLGCESASETVRDVVESADCKVIEAMEVSGIMNARLRFRFPGSFTFEDCKVVRMTQSRKGRGLSA